MVVPPTTHVELKVLPRAVVKFIKVGDVFWLAATPTAVLMAFDASAVLFESVSPYM